MDDLRNRTNYKHAMIQRLSPGADSNEIGKALDWIIERCHEIGVTHNPLKCWQPPDDRRAHYCPIWVETYLLQNYALRIAEIIDWKVLACPFDIYYTELDPKQSEHLIHEAVFLQDNIKSIHGNELTEKENSKLSTFASGLVERAGRTHAFVHLAGSSKRELKCAPDD